LDFLVFTQRELQAKARLLWDVIDLRTVPTKIDRISRFLLINASQALNF
jgi:hypothetical protein